MEQLGFEVVEPATVKFEGGKLIITLSNESIETKMIENIPVKV